MLDIFRGFVLIWPILVLLGKTYSVVIVFRLLCLYMHLQIFMGNTDPDAIVSNQLPTHRPAKCVRMYPLTWEGYPAFRLELYGCMCQTNCQVSLCLIFHE